MGRQQPPAIPKPPALPEPPLRAISQAAQSNFVKGLAGKAPVPTVALNTLQSAPNKVNPKTPLLFKLLTASAAQRAGLAGPALKELPAIVDEWVRLVPKITELLRLTPPQLLKYLREQVLKVQSSAESVGEFATEKYLNGLLKSIVGKSLFERVIKLSPALDAWCNESATQARLALNSTLNRNRTLQYLNSNNVGVDIAPFNKLTKLVRFVTELEDGTTKELTDLPFLASNPEGFQTFSLLVEIKMPGAVHKAPDQFGEFLTRVESAKRVLGYAEDGTEIEINKTKLILDPGLVNRIVVTHPSPADWYRVVGTQKVGSVVAVDMKSTQKGGDLDLSDRTDGRGGSHYRKLLYWKVTVAVKSDWLEYPIKALFGLLPPTPPTP
jgi:hypothetical protein